METNMAPRKKSRSSGTNLQSRLGALREDLEALQTDMRSLAGDAGDAASAKMNATLNDAMESVQDLTERLEVWGEDHIESVRSSVREQPLAACALAMGIGTLLGAVFLRR